MADNKSYVEIAYNVLVKYYADNNDDGKSIPMPFLDLLKEVGTELGYENEEQFLELASKFYTALTLDGRFVSKENNTWVLREHEKYEDIYIDMNKIYIDDEDEEKDEENAEKGENEDDDYLIDADDKIESNYEDEDAPVTSGDLDDDENN